MLELKNISKTYIKKGKKIEILKSVSYKFKKNNLYCIIGDSGAGKSTLIKIMGLLTGYDEGNILIDNNDVKTFNEKEKALLRNQKIGFIFQNYYLNPLMKSYENVMLPMYLNKYSNNHTRKEIAYNLLKNVGLDSREEHFPKELSGGEQERVAIARALANNPDIILADEPTGALDKTNTKNIIKILKDIAKDNKCVIIVTHDERILSYADKVLKIENQTLNEVNYEEVH